MHHLVCIEKDLLSAFMRTRPLVILMSALHCRFALLLLQIVEMTAELMLLVTYERLIFLEIETICHAMSFRSMIHFAAKRGTHIVGNACELQASYLRSLQQRVQPGRLDGVDVAAVEVIVIKLSLV